MKDRNERLMAIRRLLNAHSFSSQEELQEELAKMGFKMTQATLSRDLKYLQVAKKPDRNAGYVYVLSDQNTSAATSAESQQIRGFQSITYAQGMAIMKTLPGHASSIAYSIDTLNSYEVAGTIAGDDTILIIPRDGVTKGDLENLFRRRLPGIAAKQLN